LIYYLDSSVLVKRYVREHGSPRVRELMKGDRHFATSALAAVEIRSAVARLRREGRLDEATARRIVARLERTLPAMTVVEPRGRTLDLAGELVGRRPLRAYDAVHLASALRLAVEAGSAVTFACADASLRAAAVAEGLRALPM
jgi:predicted nucleic acid-binding protein